MVAIGAILLCAGQSQRYGPENKLLGDYKGQPLICSALQTLRALDVEEKIVVTGFEASKITPMVREFVIETCYNPNFKEGMGSSIRTGVQALSFHLDAYLIMLGDMPSVTVGLCNLVIDTFQSGNRQTLIRPSFGGQPGHPVLIPAHYRRNLIALQNDQGLRDIIACGQIPFKTIETADAACLYDIDHPIGER